MRAKEKLIAQANKLAYATDIKKILSDLLPLRLDKEATEDYYNNVLTPDIRKQNYVLQLKMHESKNAMQSEIPIESIIMKNYLKTQQKRSVRNFSTLSQKTIHLDTYTIY